MPAKPTTHDEYLAAVPPEMRATLEKLRCTIQAAYPEAEECISYQLPAFRLHGKYFVAYGAAKKHCALYPGGITDLLQEELKAYDTSKGTIRFPPDKPLPATLVRKILRTRLARDRERKP